MNLNTSFIKNSTYKYFSYKPSRKYNNFKFNFKYFIDNLPLHISNINNRKVDASAEAVKLNYNQFMKKQNDINLMRQQMNKFKQMTSDIRKKGGDANQIIKDSKKHSQDIIKFQAELDEIESSLMKEVLSIPNITHPDVPVGDEPVVLKVVGSKRKNKTLFIYLYSIILLSKFQLRPLNTSRNR